MDPNLPNNSTQQFRKNNKSSGVLNCWIFHKTQTLLDVGVELDGVHAFIKSANSSSFFLKIFYFLFFKKMKNFMCKLFFFFCLRLENCEIKIYLSLDSSSRWCSCSRWWHMQTRKVLNLKKGTCFFVNSNQKPVGILF